MKWLVFLQDKFGLWRQPRISSYRLTNQVRNKGDMLLRCEQQQANKRDLLTERECKVSTQDSDKYKNTLSPAVCSNVIVM